MNSFLQHIVYIMSVDRKTGNRNNSVQEQATKLKQPDLEEKKIVWSIIRVLALCMDHMKVF